ncbi:uncharacterized protein K452DRAFT_145314 [Aplosporella prunicola CBS 121167]|uniref:Uncharacterized protein n=1 Tax=Aplosporella prunicola CBS 121167 TaxID=1176127 RepID=A0A6A6BKM5_9PEZI|nr:uncharacterized protein K452DRAFT_145314 [Aplosporella prunicola CBS 121167]KAF2144670.1 hypothetical protein K452DRAFT_145314 [Aplosporella prunicola CBS 121167]
MPLTAPMFFISAQLPPGPCAAYRSSVFGGKRKRNQEGKEKKGTLSRLRKITCASMSMNANSLLFPFGSRNQTRECTHP